MKFVLVLHLFGDMIVFVFVLEFSICIIFCHTKDWYWFFRNIVFVFWCSVGQCCADWYFLHFTILGFWDLVVSCPGGVRRCRAASMEVSGGQGKLRVSEQWPESFRRRLGRLSGWCIFLSSLLVFCGSESTQRLKLVPEGVELRSWRSMEVRGSKS